MARRVIIAGGGVAAIEGALALDELAGDVLDVHLITPAREFVYRPLAVGEPFGRSEVSRKPVAELLAGRIRGHVFDSVREVRPEERQLVTDTDLVCSYDALLLATGARMRPSLEGAFVFGVPGSSDRYAGVLRAVGSGELRRLVFGLPRECGWALPLYELALMTAGWLFERRIAGVELTLVTHESAPLAAFGAPASELVTDMLDDAGVAVEMGVAPRAAGKGELVLEDGTSIAADMVITLPRLEGPRYAGLPSDAGGFLPVDDHGRVRGADGVWAAGDATNRPIKQGGLAAQQADAAAESIAAWAGVPIDPAPYRPVLRGLLLAGERTEYLRSGSRGAERNGTAVREKPLWWPPAKVAGRYLSPVLAAHGMETHD